MSLFKKQPLFKKSTGQGLYAKAETKLAKRHGAEEIPAANFPTSEDLKRGQPGGHDPHEHDADPDGAFLYDGQTQHVSSSNVAWLRYEGGSLYIGYHDGREYYCAGVEPRLALQIRRANSVGAALKDLERTRGAFSRM